MKRLWGWEPRTTYTYDALGRVVASQVEPEWDRQQVDLFVAYNRYQGLVGPNGEWMPDATAPGADPNDYDSGYGYAVQGPFTNYAEKARLDQIEAWKTDAGEKPNMNGLYWTVDRVDYPSH